MFIGGPVDRLFVEGVRQIHEGRRPGRRACGQEASAKRSEEETQHSPGDVLHHVTSSALPLAVRARTLAGCPSRRNSTFFFPPEAEQVKISGARASMRRVGGRSCGFSKWN